MDSGFIEEGFLEEEFQDDIKPESDSYLRHNQDLDDLKNLLGDCLTLSRISGGYLECFWLCEELSGVYFILNFFIRDSVYSNFVGTRYGR